MTDALYLLSRQVDEPICCRGGRGSEYLGLPPQPKSPHKSPLRSDGTVLSTPSMLSVVAELTSCSAAWPSTLSVVAVVTVSSVATCSTGRRGGMGGWMKAGVGAGDAVLKGGRIAVTVRRSTVLDGPAEPALATG